MASHREQMEKTLKFQIVYAGLTNRCQHSTNDLARGIMANERKQSALSKAGSFNPNVMVFQFSLTYHARFVDRELEKIWDDVIHVGEE